MRVGSPWARATSGHMAAWVKEQGWHGAHVACDPRLYSSHVQCTEEATGLSNFWRGMIPWLAAERQAWAGALVLVWLAPTKTIGSNRKLKSKTQN